jgi:hypothetical protein
MLLCAFLQKKTNLVLIFGNKTIPTKYTWNFIDSKLGTFTQQTGILEGIANMPPLAYF